MGLVEVEAGGQPAGQGGECERRISDSRRRCRAGEKAERRDGE